MSDRYGYTTKYADQLPKMVPIESLYPDMGKRAGMWQGAVISEDMKTVALKSHGVHPTDPVGHLLGIWDLGQVPTPMFEEYGGFFGRFLRSDYKSERDPFEEDVFLEKIKGGFHFSGNHLTLSHGFNIYTGDVALAKLLLTRLASCLASHQYQDTVLKMLSNQLQWGTRGNHLYYSKIGGFYTCRLDKHLQAQAVLSGEVLLSTKTGRDSRVDDWAKHVSREATYLGLRKDFNLGEVLLQKLDDQAEHFSKMLPWDYVPEWPRRGNYLMGDVLALV